MKKSFHFQPNSDTKQILYEETLVNMNDSSIIKSIVPTTPLLSMRTEVGHFF